MAGKTNKPTKKAKAGKAATQKCVAKTGTGVSGAPANQAVRVRGASSKGKFRRQGTDLMTDKQVNAGFTGIVEQVVITPSLFPRLGRISQAYQRIRYHRLRFEIITGCSTATSGVYVAGFVKDATDPLTSAHASSTLLAAGGNSQKMWQSDEVVVNSFPPDLYYTSTTSVEKRWSSPGSFCIVITAPPDKAVSLLVYVHWDVTLTEDTLEDKQGDDGFHTALVDMFTSDSNTYLACRGSDPKTWRTLLHSDFSPPLEPGDVITLLSFRFPAVKNSSNTTDGVFGFIELHASENKVYPRDDQKNGSTQPFDGYTYVIKKGEKFEVTRAPNQKASWFRSTMGRYANCAPCSGMSSDTRRPDRLSSPRRLTSPDHSSGHSGAMRAPNRDPAFLGSPDVQHILNGLLRLLNEPSRAGISCPSREPLTDSQQKLRDSLGDYELDEE